MDYSRSRKTNLPMSTTVAIVAAVVASSRMPPESDAVRPTSAFGLTTVAWSPILNTHL